MVAVSNLLDQMTSLLEMEQSMLDELHAQENEDYLGNERITMNNLDEVTLECSCCLECTVIYIVIKIEKQFIFFFIIFLRTRTHRRDQVKHGDSYPEQRSWHLYKTPIHSCSDRTVQNQAQCQIHPVLISCYLKTFWRTY